MSGLSTAIRGFGRWVHADYVGDALEHSLSHHGSHLLVRRVRWRRRSKVKTSIGWLVALVTWVAVVLVCFWSAIGACNVR